MSFMASGVSRTALSQFPRYRVSLDKQGLMERSQDELARAIDSAWATTIGKGFKRCSGIVNGGRHIALDLTMSVDPSPKAD